MPDFGPDLVEVFGPSQADGGPELIQLLTPEGERVDHPSSTSTSAPRQLRGFYRDMVLTRRIDTEATALQRHGELGIWAQLLGQEAAQIGAGRALRPQDYVFPTYREHGVAYCRGVDPLNLLGLFRGVDHGAWDPNENNFGLYTIVIGAQTLHATGYAMGIQRDGAVGTGDPDRDAAVIAHFGDGASSQGDVNEAFIFAASYNAPVVFFCQNNQWAISEPIERQTRIPLYQRALGFGFPGVRVDGNDVLATYAVTQAALQRAREGSGPTFVEAYTYRMGAHTTTDDPTRYRLSDDVEHWKLKDPIARVEVYLSRNGLVDDDFFADGGAGGRRARRTTCARAARRCPTRSRWTCSTTSTPRRPTSCAGSARASRRTSRRSRRRAHEERDAEDHPRQGPQHGPAQGDGGRPQGPDHGRGRRQARRRLPDHRRPAEGLRRGPGHRLARWPSPASSAPRSAWRCAATGRSCEIQFDGFVYPAYDQIVCQVAKMNYRSKGRSTMPMVIRIPFGGGIGAVEHHSESPEAQFAHTPGLKVVACSNPVDGYWMIQQAIACDDPVIFLEPKRQYHADKAELDESATPDPLFSSRVVRQGTDVTVLAYGPMVKTALQAAEAASTEGRRSRSSTCARCRRWTWVRSSSPYAAPAAPSSPTRRTSTSAWARRSRPGSPRSASTPWRRRCCGSAGSTRPTPPRGSRRTTSPTSTGCSTPSTDPRLLGR